MILQDIKVKINEIALDPYNPRDLSFTNKTQREILSITLDRKETKELLKSMQDCTRWINKIVIITVAEHKKLFDKNNTELDQYKYVAIEGNTRLACLRSQKIPQYVDGETEIPVILASREEDEDNSLFKEAILVTQGIANVMEVKPWSTISKAKHIHDMFLLKLKNQTDTNPQIANKNAIKSVSEELGIDQAEIRTAVKRYTVYEKVAEYDKRLDEDEWGYLEAFETNPDTRSFIGLSDTFEWDEDKAETAVPLITGLIKNTRSQNITTKRFRDDFKKYIKQNNDKGIEHQDTVDELQTTIEEKKLVSTLLVNEPVSQVDEEQEWKEKLENILNTLTSYPILKPWKVNQKTEINNILNCIQQISKSI